MPRTKFLETRAVQDFLKTVYLLQNQTDRVSTHQFSRGAGYFSTFSNGYGTAIKYWLATIIGAIVGAWAYRSIREPSLEASTQL